MNALRLLLAVAVTLVARFGFADATVTLKNAGNVSINVGAGYNYTFNTGSGNETTSWQYPAGCWSGTTTLAAGATVDFDVTCAYGSPIQSNLGYGETLESVNVDGYVNVSGGMESGLTINVPGDNTPVTGNQGTIYLWGCESNYNVTATNPNSVPAIPTVIWSSGQVSSTGVTTNDPIAAGATFSAEYAEACGLTWSVTWATTVSTNGMGGAMTNTPVGATNNPTLPSVPSGTNGVPGVGNPSQDTTNNIIWTPGVPGVTNLGNGLNNTLWSGIQGATANANGIINALTNAEGQAHADAGQIVAAIQALQLETDTNFAGVIGALGPLQGVSTSTNQATMIGQLAVIAANTGAAATNSFGAGALVAGLSNAAVAMNGVSTSISNVTDWTNLDIMSQTTGLGLSNVMAGISNSLFGSNGYSFNTNNIVLSGMSNILAGMSNSAYGTNGMTNGLALVLPSSATNGAAATSAGNAVFGASETELQSLLDSLSGASVADSLDPGHTSAWDLDVFGTVIDCDPVDMFPGVCAFSLGLWGFAMVAWYLFSVGKLYMQVLGLVATTKLASVPNLDVLGTNALGLAVGTVVPAIFLGLWFLVVSVVVPGLATYIGFFTAIGSVVTSASGTTAGACGVHVLVNVIPVVLGIRLLIARITLQFTVAKATMIAVAASRFLFGGG